MKYKVAVSRQSKYEPAEILDSLKRLIDDLGGVSNVFSPGNKVLVKPNLLMGKGSDSAVTTNQVVVDGVLQLLKDAGTSPFICEIPGLVSLEVAAKATGITEVCKRLDIPLREPTEFIPADNTSGVGMPSYTVPVELEECDCIVNLPKLKTHTLMNLTLSVKNVFGLMKQGYRSNWHLRTGRDSTEFAKMLIGWYSVIDPDLTIMDGVVGMEGDGPSAGKPRRFGALLASENGLALDAVLVDWLGLTPDEVPIQDIAIKSGLAGSDIADVSFVGDELPRLDRPILPPSTYLSKKEGLVGKVLQKVYPFVEHWFTTQPYVGQDTCKKCQKCLKFCPANAITYEDDKVEIDEKKCIQCFCCHEICPDDSIILKQSWLRKGFDYMVNRRLRSSMQKEAQK